MFILSGPENLTLRRVPVVSLTLMAFCLVVSTAQPFFVPLHTTLGVLGFVPDDPGLIALLLHPFIHHGAAHLLAAFLVFYVTGPYLEDRWGRVFFSCFFMVAAMVAAIVYLCIFPNARAPHYGACSAAAAVLGAYLVRYHRTRLRFVYLIQILKRETFGSAWLLVPLWLVVQIPSAYFWPSRTGYVYVDLVGQTAGFLFGIVTALVIKYRNLEPLLYQSPFEKLPELERLTITADNLRKQGDKEALLDHLADAWRKYPDHPEFTEQYWSQAVRMNRVEGARMAGLRQIERAIDAGEYGPAYYHWLELTKACPRETPRLARLEMLAHGLLSVGLQLEAENLMRTTLAHLPHNLHRDSLLSVLETARMVSPALAIQALDQQCQAPGRDEQDLAALQAFREELLTFYPNALTPPPEKREIDISGSPSLLPVELEEDPFAPTHVTALKLIRLHLTDLQEQGPELAASDGTGRRILPHESILALSAAVIRPPGAKGTLLLDLLLDEPFKPRAVHRVVRIYDPGFNPQRLLPHCRNAMEAATELITRLLERASAVPLPDGDGYAAGRLEVYDAVATYEAAVYGLS